MERVSYCLWNHRNGSALGKGKPRYGIAFSQGLEYTWCIMQKDATYLWDIFAPACFMPQEPGFHSLHSTMSAYVWRLRTLTRQHPLSEYNNITVPIHATDPFIAYLQLIPSLLVSQLLCLEGWCIARWKRCCLSYSNLDDLSAQVVLQHTLFKKDLESLDSFWISRVRVVWAFFHFLFVLTSISLQYQSISNLSMHTLFIKYLNNKK